MNRRALIPLLAFIATLGIAAAPALAKPKVAVLGLEVIDDGSMDARTTLRGKQLSEKLREQAGRGSGKFELAPNSNKDLLEMKLLSNCSDEAHSCMAQIGQELGADKLIYGKIERQQNGYFVSLKMLDTKTAKLGKTSNHVIPFSDHQADRLAGHAATLYRRLTGEPALGALVLKVKNADKGTVYLDGEIRTSLAAGSATIRDVSEGKHTISIESDGYVRFSKEVSVSGGKSQELSIKLKAADGANGGEGRGLYKGLAWTGAAVAVAGGTGLVVTGVSFLSAENEHDRKVGGVRDALGLDNCSKPEVMCSAMQEEEEQAKQQAFQDDACESARNSSSSDDEVNEFIKNCDKGEKNAFRFNFVALPVTIVGALAAGYFGYKGYFSSGDDALERRTASKRKKKPKRRVKIEPLFGPDGVAASVRVEF